MDDLRCKNALVVGLGRSGTAAARYLARSGAAVTVSDSRGEEELSGEIASLRGTGAAFSLGRNDPMLADGCDLVVLSPGVSPDIELAARARSRGVPVISELELALRAIDRPLIAVTGTNGKTTTTALIGHMLERAGIPACVAGNIGTPLLDVLEAAARSEFVVLEVSSFQIDLAPSLSAHIAVWLNATEDHIDRHGTFESYVASKARLFAQAASTGFGIYNAGDSVVSAAISGSRCELVPFSSLRAPASASRAWAEGPELMVQVKGSPVERFLSGGEGLKGAHNTENALAAVLAARLAGAPFEAVREALASFKGLPHRVELVGEYGGVRYYDDSKGTNVGATSRALESFDCPVVLIAGGVAKGAGFDDLVPAVRGRVKLAVLIGEAAGEIEKSIRGAAEVRRAASMDDAVALARSAASSGDAVLLSPACASFDMFKDYAERGRAFTESVRRQCS